MIILPTVLRSFRWIPFHHCSESSNGIIIVFYTDGIIIKWPCLRRAIVRSVYYDSVRIMMIFNDSDGNYFYS